MEKTTRLISIPISKKASSVVIYLTTPNPSYALFPFPIFFVSAYIWVSTYYRMEPSPSIPTISLVSGLKSNHTAASVSSISHQLLGPLDPCRMSYSATIVGARATAMMHVPQRGGECHLCILNGRAAKGGLHAPKEFIINNRRPY
jgi:hypothetical protein